MAIEEGIIAGLWGGVIMALLSETGFRLGMSNSSLMLVDGLFAFRTMRKQPQPRVVYLLGTIIHLFTSAVFGVVYVVGCRILGIDPVSFSTLSVYASSSGWPCSSLRCPSRARACSAAGWGPTPRSSSS